MNDLKPLKVNQSQSKKKWKFLLQKKWLILLLILLFLGGMAWTRLTTTSVFNFVFGREPALQVENRQVNILLLGIAGGNHDGPNLTDTIMVASYSLDTRQATLISLPRDLWIEKYKGKVNSLYELGLERGDGLDFTSKEIGEILGISLPYVVRLDFNGFVKAVDLVGGLDVEVVRSFDDYEYPIEGHADDLCGYQEKNMEITEEQGKSLGIAVGTHKVLLGADGQIATASAQINGGIDYTNEQLHQYFACRFAHLSFQKGNSHLDGETALKFVRSRHGTNGEGSDFARSKRQQQVLQAFKDKILSLNTLADPSKIIGLIRAFGASIDTNIPSSQYLGFIKMAKELEGTKSIVIDSSGDDPLLITPSTGDFGGAWVLLPQGGNYDRIHAVVSDTLSGKDVATASAKKSQP